MNRETRRKIEKEQRKSSERERNEKNSIESRCPIASFLLHSPFDLDLLRFPNKQTKTHTHNKQQSQQHRFSFNEPMPVESVTQSLCDLALAFGEDSDDEGGSGGGMSRPFGVALLLAGWDPTDGPVLFQTDPSGTYVAYGARAIGAGAEGAQATLQDAWKEDLTLAEAEKLALSTLKQVMEEKVTPTNVDIASVAPKYKLYSPEEVSAVIERL